MEKVRSRCWVLVLYPEDTTHVECMSTLAQGGYNYAAILHDKDTYEEDIIENDIIIHKQGDTKKSHWHIVLRLTNAQWRDGIAKEIGIPSNYLEVCRDRDSALLYLVHEGYPSKYQYDVNDVFGPLTPNLQKLLVDNDEGQRVKSIVHMIDASPGRCSYREILLKACDNGLYGEFRRLGSGVKWLIDEHNEDIGANLHYEYNPTMGAYERAKTQARFEGFVHGCESMRRDADKLYERRMPNG